jgi:hypothetical protein
LRKGKFMKEYMNTIRLANLLLEAFCELRKQRLRQIQNSFEDFSCKCTDVTRDSHLFYAAVEKGWLSSAEKVIYKVSRNLTDYSHHLQKFQELINMHETHSPRLSDIIEELHQIDQELGEYQFDLKERTISVVTEPITLNDTPLGPFEIKLSIDQIEKLYTNSPYRIIALESNPAGADDSVTHPHVNSERLCEGDGHVSIVKALEQGRLCDFFTMVTSILQTYNPDSPYVSLDDWQGISCYDCGCTVSGDDCYYCEYCDRDHCSQCSTYCQKCESTICLGCAYECPSCNEPVCQRCTSKCKECGETFCTDCLDDEGLCPDCEEQRKEDSDEEQQEKPKKAETGAAVQSDSVGQAAVHAGHD